MSIQNCAALFRCPSKISLVGGSRDQPGADWALSTHTCADVATDQRVDGWKRSVLARGEGRSGDERVSVRGEGRSGDERASLRVRPLSGASK
eukprot:109586-Chlamydomonas_euryale.AAC.1